MANMIHEIMTDSDRINICQFDKDTQEFLLVESGRNPAWMARITGRDEKYIFAREFLTGSEAGRAIAYKLTDGLYCWSEKRGKQNYGIYADEKFYNVTQGEMLTIVNNLYKKVVD